MTITGRVMEIIGQLATAALDPGKVYTIEIREHKKRSRVANAYYWSLLHQYAKWASRSNIWMHNDTLECFGHPMVADDSHAATITLSEKFDYKALP